MFYSIYHMILKRLRWLLGGGGECKAKEFVRGCYDSHYVMLLNM